MPRRPTPTVAAPTDLDRLRSLVAADGRPQAAIADAIGWTRQELSQRLRGANLTVASARRLLAAIRVVDPDTGVVRPGRLADLD